MIKHTCRCVLINYLETKVRNIIEFYNLHLFYNLLIYFKSNILLVNFLSVYSKRSDKIYTCLNP